jgi:hypothetical protein
MDSKDSAFPIQISQKDDATGATFTCTTVGGLSLHAHFTSIILQGFAANPAFVGGKIQFRDLKELAIKEGAELALHFKEAE